MVKIEVSVQIEGEVDVQLENTDYEEYEDVGLEEVVYWAMEAAEKEIEDVILSSLPTLCKSKEVTVMTKNGVWTFEQNQ